LTYRFPTTKHRVRRERHPRFKFETGEVKEKEIGLIQDIKAKSKEEWMVSKALDAMKMEYIYQYPLFGGTARRGGYVVDFLVRVAPSWIPLEVQSLRWHSGKFSSHERLRAALIELELGERLRYVWEHDLKNVNEATAAIRKALFQPIQSA
jgi:hypothetical protein